MQSYITTKKILDDKYARLLLSTGEHEQIGAHMALGVSFFDPAFRGDAGDALRRVMDEYLSPTPLARAAFAAEELSRSGVAQVLSLAAGYDTVGYASGILGHMARSCGLRLALYLTPQDIQARFFDPYNTEVEGCPMYAPADVAYCVLTRA